LQVFLKKLEEKLSEKLSEERGEKVKLASD